MQVDQEEQQKTDENQQQAQAENKTELEEMEVKILYINFQSWIMETKWQQHDSHYLLVTILHYVLRSPTVLVGCIGWHLRTYS